jgi:glycerol-3-phosphate acyltransferase PlsY
MSYDLGTALFIAIASYLLGSISFSRLVTAFKSPGKDIADTEINLVESGETIKVGHIGAKVALPSLTCKLIFPELPYYVLIAGIAGMAGHNWPIYYRFNGGMGFSPAMGSLLVVDWLSIIVLPIAGTLLGLITRNMVVISSAWMWLLIPWMWFRTYDWVYVLYAVLVNILFLLAMLPEIKRGISFWRAGKLDEYGESMLASNPMGRGMIKMVEKFKFSNPPE